MGKCTHSLQASERRSEKMSATNPADPPRSTQPSHAYRATRDRNPFAACGRTVSNLMNIPNLARLPFGQIAKLVVRQINRGHYFFVVDPSSAVCGYCGWTQGTHAEADAWLERNIEVSSAHPQDGPVGVINIWQAALTRWTSQRLPAQASTRWQTWSSTPPTRHPGGLAMATALARHG
jgi:hypothetical protein